MLRAGSNCISDLSGQHAENWLVSKRIDKMVLSCLIENQRSKLVQKEALLGKTVPSQKNILIKGG